MESERARIFRMEHLHEAMFSLNITFAVGICFLASGFRYIETSSSPVPLTDFRYLFLTRAFRANSALHLTYSSHVGQELTFIVSVLCLTVPILLCLRLVAGSRLHHIFLTAVAGMTAVFAVPVCLYLSRWANIGAASADLATVHWQRLDVTILAADIVCISSLIAFALIRHLSIWGGLVLLALHCGFWSIVLWHEVSRVDLISPLLSLFIFPASGLVWLSYLKYPRSDVRQNRIKWTTAISLFVTASFIFGFLWRPAKSWPISRTKDIHDLTITLTRRGCFGKCPVYTVKIDGTGLVEYRGARDVRIIGLQTSAISSQQLATLLQRFDGINFSRLDDRAFDKCADTEVVSVSVAADGREKTVNSDTFCVGARHGRQAQFVKLANEIDSMVGSNRWVACNGYCSP
jgi:hypothetical protein